MSAKCNGVCLRASDVGVGVAGNPVAYAHPDCPEHGSGEAEAVAAIARRLGVTFGGVPEIVCALDSLEGRAAIAERHAKALTRELKHERRAGRAEREASARQVDDFGLRAVIAEAERDAVNAHVRDVDECWRAAKARVVELEAEVDALTKRIGDLT